MIKCAWRLNKMYWKRPAQWVSESGQDHPHYSINNSTTRIKDTFWLFNVTEKRACQQVQSLSYSYALLIAIKSQLKIYPEQKIIQRHLPFPLVAIVLKTCLRNAIVSPCLDMAFLGVLFVFQIDYCFSIVVGYWTEWMFSVFLLVF